MGKMVAIVMAFGICVFPKYCIRLIFAFTSMDFHMDYWEHLQYLANLPYPLHVAINPIIYSFVDPTWRKDVMNIFYRISTKLRNVSRANSPAHNVMKEMKHLDIEVTMSKSLTLT